MERIPINLRSALQFTAEEIKMYEKLLSACALRSAPVQGPDSALRLWGTLEEKDACVGLRVASGAGGTPGSALLLPKRRSPALHVFRMRHDSPLPPQRVWFSQKWEDLAGQCRNVKGLVND